ncbi:RHS repeat-associated core domain-containing protein [Pseudomonas sp. KNUC1026]|uniref:RHS repeat-associated core domain-containing protein n=1 Tax=Pseudomonas sp. KNUC1026 TaxID=2893890 RepID=UPI001F3E6987|nr:RHS repeat-associated core domain-containing protein [Pseudomonas sp. KNUC1026]UFH50917.1 RHS repeat-associated core domain-containing protein [Pseudomonas sp. KNUC1026]
MNVCIRTDIASTVLHSRMAYTPFGAHYPRNAKSMVGFAGELAEASTAAYLLGHGYRRYLSGLMKFSRPDHFSPFGAGGLNAYAYGKSEPVNNLDPSGASLISMLGRMIRLLERAADRVWAMQRSYVPRVLLLPQIGVGVAVGARGVRIASALIPGIAQSAVARAVAQSTSNIAGTLIVSPAVIRLVQAPVNAALEFATRIPGYLDMSAVLLTRRYNETMRQAVPSFGHVVQQV